MPPALRVRFGGGAVAVPPYASGDAPARGRGPPWTGAGRRPVPAPGGWAKQSADCLRGPRPAGRPAPPLLVAGWPSGRADDRRGAWDPSLGGPADCNGSPSARRSLGPRPTLGPHAPRKRDRPRLATPP